MRVVESVTWKVLRAFARKRVEWCSDDQRPGSHQSERAHRYGAYGDSPGDFDGATMASFGAPRSVLSCLFRDLSKLGETGHGGC